MTIIQPIQHNLGRGILMEENDGLPLICRGESSLASPVDDDDGGECEDGLPLGSTKTGNIRCYK